jgi:hypothetical protein
MKKLAPVLAGTAIVAGVLLSGCLSNNPHPNQPPVPTTAATNDNGDNSQLTIPSDLVGKNAQMADDELHQVGFVNIKYAPQNAPQTRVDNLADWNVTKVEPAGGSVALSNANIVVTVVKK